MVRRPFLVSLMLALALAPVSASSDEKPASSSQTSLPATSLYHEWLAGWATPTTGDQVRYGLDPETGEWGYVAIPYPLATLGVSAEPLVIHHADGSIEVVMPPGMTEYLVARVGADGRLNIGCATPTDLTRALAAPQSGAPDR